MSAISISRTHRRRWWWFLWGLMTVLALGIAGYFVPPYLHGGQNFPVDRTVVGYYTSLVFHAVPAGLTLVIGPWQFVPALRRRFPKAHRIAGRVYLVCVVFASAAAAYAAAVTRSGFPLQVAFFLLIVVWLYTAARAFLAIRRGDVQLHRIWMIRNYSLTFAAVTLRLYQIIGLTFLYSMSWSNIYTASAWAALVGNVFVCEYFIVNRTLENRVRHRQSDTAVTGSPQPVAP